MSFNVGEILCIKTTSERVCVLWVDATSNEVGIRRPIAFEGGNIQHSEEKFSDFELETVTNHAERQVNEMILKSKAQVKLMKVETKLQKELEEDEVLSDSETKPALSVVPKLN